jgi:CubicO group peptidase (beta-lactamase class C family)
MEKVVWYNYIDKSMFTETIMDKKTIMENMAKAAYERGVFNGLWLYAENGEIVSKGAYGFRDAEDKFPMQEDSIFQLASITKQFTATAIMLLKRQGLLRLEDRITEYFPELTVYNDVTILHLLTHTSGMPDDEDDRWCAKVWKESGTIPANDITLRFLCESGEGPLAAPGELFEYSNPGYQLLAEIVEKVSGMRFEDYLKKHVFEPAGMLDTGVYHCLRDCVPSDRFVRNLVLEDGKYILPETSRRDAGEIHAEDGLNGSSNVYTTVFDMLRWDRALREETVLSREEQRMMFTAGKLNNGEDAGDEERGGYGLGWYVQSDPDLGPIVAHSGGLPGLGTWYERGVDVDRCFIFANTRDYEDVRAYWSFAEGMIAVARDKEPDPVEGIEDLMIKDPDKSKWESFCGKYAHPEDADFIIDEVFLKDGEIYANAIDEEYGELTFRLYPIGENTFGRKGGYLELEFGDNCVMYDDFTCKKK